MPDLGIDWIKAKIDTGARTSSLHAFHIESFQRNGEEYVRFRVHPVQRNAKTSVISEAKVIEYRNIRSSNGIQTRRPVIQTSLNIANEVWLIELTLANRDQMGFRMLLGRESFRKRVLIDAGRSYLTGKPLNFEKT